MPERPTDQTTLDLARHVLETEAQAILGPDPSARRRVRAAVDAAASTARGRVIVTGMGKSGIIAASSRRRCRAPARRPAFLHPAEALHGDLGIVASGDVVVALSHSGETTS